VPLVRPRQPWHGLVLLLRKLRGAPMTGTIKPGGVREIAIGKYIVKLSNDVTVDWTLTDEGEIYFYSNTSGGTVQIWECGSPDGLAVKRDGP
jgi:hypothetical protein